MKRVLATIFALLVAVSAFADKRAVPLAMMGRENIFTDVAAAVVYLATASYVTGEVIRVDGGRHIR